MPRPNLVKVCDCFFDVGVYCMMKDLSYRDFFTLCIKERDDKRCSFMIWTHEDCFIACCMTFFQTSVKISGLEKLKLSLTSNCFYSNAGFDSDDHDDVSSCITTNFDEQNISYFCFYCQNIILVGFREKLHCIACRINYSP